MIDWLLRQQDRKLALSQGGLRIPDALVLSIPVMWASGMHEGERRTALKAPDAVLPSAL
jgi:hypothetical protein